VSPEGADLVEFLRARLDEDEQWALAASKPYRHAKGTPEVPAGGVHWTWVVGDNWEPITPDPVVDEFVSRDEEWSCNLATVEEWPSENDGHMMPTTYAGAIEEMDAVAARHIARHDPARVLREVEAKRRVVNRYAENPAEPWPLFPLLEMAAVYADHPNYREEWSVT
jgi:hypothetical protein